MMDEVFTNALKTDKYVKVIKSFTKCTDRVYCKMRHMIKNTVFLHNEGEIILNCYYKMRCCYKMQQNMPSHSDVIYL